MKDTLNKRHYSYLKGTDFRVFKSYKKMMEFAINSEHDGVYYVDCPNITFRYSREQVLSK